MPFRNRLTSATLVLLLATAAGAANAVPTFDAQFSSHAVLQRGQPLTVTGTASPGEPVTVRLGTAQASGRADSRGRWSAALPAQGAGGPFRLDATSASGSATSEDVMLGDVWLCSGQSNMEFPLSRALNGAGEVEAATDAKIRLFKVPQRAVLDPAPFGREVQWQVTSPHTAGNFSAACTFMARQLREREPGVPLGLIDSSWGGTAIRAWMDATANRAGGNVADADLLARYRRNAPAALRDFGATWGAWWRQQSGDAAGSEPWRASDRLTWRPLPSFTYWENWGLPEFAQFNGGAWARKRVTLTAAQAAHAATLSFGVVDDADTTFVNGVLVGTTYSWSEPRHYALPPDTLHAGNNELLVFIRDNYGFGGFKGPAELVKLSFAGAGDLPLGSGWEISVAPPKVGEPPLAPWDGQSGLGNLYNGMIAPFGRFGLTGVAWYQGEADVGKAHYDRRLAALMSSWRQQFGRPDLPFLIVGLAGWGKPAATPTESGWAALIDEQRLGVAADRRAALVSAIDLGEPADIHPANKQEVGRRLALAARFLAQQPDGLVGPVPVSVSRGNGGVLIRFSKPLQSFSGAPLGFELCGAAAGSCRFVRGSLAEGGVLLSDAQAADTRVRYAWADYPVVNLYDRDLLPAPVFELPLR